MRQLLGLLVVSHVCGFNIVHPKQEAVIFTEDLLVGIEFFASVEPSLDYFLFIRFDGDHNITGQDAVFSAHGSSHGFLGSPVDSVFGHAFAIPPGSHILEARLGYSWDHPVSQGTVASVKFTKLESCHHGASEDAMPMVIDAFPFFNELDLLELRLLELWEVVDLFILVESSTTHSGLQKPLVFSEVAQSHRFSEYSSKIRIVVDRYDESLIGENDNKMLSREEHQRDVISLAIDQLQVPANTLVLICDVDEVPRKEALQQLQQCWAHAVKPMRLLMDWYIYSTRWLSPRPWGVFAKEGAVAVTANMLKTATPSQWRRALRTDVRIPDWSTAESLTHFGTLPQAGWHFSSFGGPLAVKEKLRSYIGAELFGAPVYEDVDRLARLVRYGVPYFDLATMTSMTALVRVRGKPPRGGVSTFSHVSSNASFELTLDDDYEWESSLPWAVLEVRHYNRHLPSFVKDEDEDDGELGLLSQDALKARVALSNSGGFIMATEFGDDSEESKQLISKLSVDCWGDIKLQTDLHCAEHYYSPHACMGLFENVERECVLGKRGKRYYRNTFVVDTARRFEIVRPGMDKETGVHVIEVWPWNDINQVAALESQALALDEEQTAQLEAFLWQGLENDSAFMHYRNRFLGSEGNAQK